MADSPKESKLYREHLIATATADDLRYELRKVEADRDRAVTYLRRWFTDDDLSVHAEALREEILEWLAVVPPEPEKRQYVPSEHRYPEGDEVAVPEEPQ